MPTAKSTLLSLAPLSDTQGGTGLNALGAGVATFLGSPTSSNFLAAVTGETGTGGVVFQVSPTLTTPILGAATATSIVNASGTLAAPSYSFSIQTSTGMFLAAAGDLRISVGGVFSARFTSTALTLGANLSASVINCDSVTFNTPTGIVGDIGSTIPAGSVGQLISSTVLFASSISLVTTIAANVTFLDVTPGHFYLFGNVYLGGASNISAGLGWISSTSASLPDESTRYYVQGSSMSAAASPVPGRVISVTTTTRYYLSAYANFPSGAVTACGNIYAYRIV